MVLMQMSLLINKLKRRSIIRRLSTVSLSLLLATLCHSCGYRTPTNQLGNETVVLNIPLIRGDENGYLRADLAKVVSESPGFRYSSSASARYSLEVKIISDSNETIGYTWDQKPITGEFIKRLFPNEGRRKVKAQVSLYDTEKNKNAISPYTIEGFADYDFVNPTAIKNIEFNDAQGDAQSVLQYSLGQLDSEEGARIESFQPLSQTLASYIMEALRRAPPLK